MLLCCKTGAVASLCTCISQAWSLTCKYRYIFVEYGPMELDLNLRVRVAELQKALEEQVCVRICT